MSLVISIPLLAAVAVLQSTVLSRVTLLRGSADLMLLVLLAWALHRRVDTAWHWAVVGGLIASLSSALPFGGALIGYLIATGLAWMLRQRVWQTPVLAMFLATFLGTLLTHLVSLATLQLAGSPLPWFEAINLVTLPSVILNFLLAIPVYSLITDLGDWLYPEELEV